MTTFSRVDSISYETMSNPYHRRRLWLAVSGGLGLALVALASESAPLWLLVATAAVDAAHAVYRLRHPGDSAVDAIALDMLVIFVVLAVLRPPSAVLPVVLIYLLAPPGIFLATRAAAWAIGSSLVGVSALRWLLPATDPQGAETVAVVAVLAIAVLPAVVWFLAAIAEILSGRRRIEMDLERAASRFEALFDRSVVPMFRTRFDGVLIDANASLVELLRAPDGDALEGISVLRLYEHPARRIRMIESLERWGQVKGLEVDLRRLDGSVFLARITASLVEQDDETVIEGILEDVTDERIAEERERISSQVFNQLGSAVVISDAERRITFWNRCAEEMFGLSEGDVIGKSARDVLKSPRIGDADDIGSRLDSAGFWQGEADVLAEDGTIVQCAVSVSLVETADGSPAGFAMVFTDQGERNAVRRDLRFQAAVLEHVHNAVIATDPDGRVTYWNPAAERMYGWDASEAVGSRVRDLTVPVTGRVAAAEVMETLARNGRWQRELELARRDGSTFSALVTNAVLTDDNGETLGVVSVSADLTDLKQAQDRARDSGDLARSVLESLHSPVAVVDYTVRSSTSTARGSASQSSMTETCYPPVSAPITSTSAAEPQRWCPTPPRRPMGSETSSTGGSTASASSTRAMVRERSGTTGCRSPRSTTPAPSSATSTSPPTNWPSARRRRSSSRRTASSPRSPTSFGHP